MRARDVSLFVICIAVAAPLVGTTGVFTGGPAGVTAEVITDFFVVSAVVGILLGGGISIAGFSFRIPAVLSAFGLMYGFAVGMIEAMILQMIQPQSMGWLFAIPLGALFAVIGYWAALELTSGAHGPYA